MEQRWQIPQDSLNRLVEPLKDLKAHGFDTLLQSLFSDLKVSGTPFFPAFPLEAWHRREDGEGGGGSFPPNPRLRPVGGTAVEMQCCWGCPSNGPLKCSLAGAPHILTLPWPERATGLGASGED